MGFFETFTSGSYHKDMETLKISASNTKLFRFWGIFKKWQIDYKGGGWGVAKYYIFLDNFCLK